MCTDLIYTQNISTCCLALVASHTQALPALINKSYISIAVNGAGSTFNVLYNVFCVAPVRF